MYRRSEHLKKNYQQKNAEKIKAYKKIYYKQILQPLNAISKSYKLRNREKIIEERRPQEKDNKYYKLLIKLGSSGQSMQNYQKKIILKHQSSEVLKQVKQENIKIEEDKNAKIEYSCNATCV